MSEEKKVQKTEEVEPEVKEAVTAEAEPEVKEAVAAEAEPEVKEAVTTEAEPETVNAAVPVPAENSKKENEALSFFRKKKKVIIPGAAFLAVLILLICLLSKPKVVFISAEYKGDTKADTVLSDKNKGFVVTGINEKGKEVRLRGWKVEDPAILKADESEKVIIKYKDLAAEVEVECTTSAAEKISAEYSGSLKAGTTITIKNIAVKANLKNGKDVDVSSDCVLKPESLTLEADGKYTVDIEYKDPVSTEVLKTSIDLECSTWSIKSISASYDGNTEAGAVLDEKNEDIKVLATLKDGKQKEVTGWKVEKAVELKEDSTGTVKILYEDYSCELKVECTTMSEKKYKSKCQAISYDKLIKNPSETYGKYIKLTGTVFQVVNDRTSGVDFTGETPTAQFCSLTATSTAYVRGYSPYRGYSTYLIKNNGNIYYVLIPNTHSKTRLVENDTVTVWGTVSSLYTYETLLGSSKTVPEIYAEYYS